jgi:2-polyprenyl-3-methyl-5-hydroxy-6-metoxy-1,4-benzoquinol methylase
VEHKTEYIKTCPICESENLQEHLKINDYFLSKEIFTIQKCGQCGFKLTSPRPSKENIGSYYKSEDYISHSNKSQGIFAAVYQLARKLNLSSKYAIIAKHTKPGKALDIGTGTGHFLNYLQNKQWNVQGIEPNKVAAEFARTNFNLKIDSEKKLSELENGSFDLITMWHVLEHVHNLNERMNELERLIKPNGLVILALPNTESYDENYYVKYWAAYDVPRHLYHFCKRDVKELAQKHNLRIEKIYPMKLDAFYVSLLSEKYIGKKWGALRAFYIALRSNWKSSSKNPNTSSLIYILRPNKA